MKSSLLFITFVVLSVSAVASTDFLTSYEIIPARPGAGEPFRIRLEGWWPNPCFSGNATAFVHQDKIYIDINVTPSTQPCITLVVDWVYDVIIDGQSSGVYSIEYRFYSSNPSYTTNHKFLGFVPVGLPNIQKCNIISGMLTTSGGFDGSGFGSFSVTGSFSFVDTGDDSWLSDVEIFADDPQNRVGDLSELFGLSEAAVYMENNTYTHYGAGERSTTLTIEENTGDQITLEGMFQEGCCDMYQYNLVCVANIDDHAICKKFPTADTNKDCKVDIRDLAIMLSEWLDCNLLDQADCMQ